MTRMYRITQELIDDEGGIMEFTMIIPEDRINQYMFNRCSYVGDLDPYYKIIEDLEPIDEAKNKVLKLHKEPT
jgi:hypothetical protein